MKRVLIPALLLALAACIRGEPAKVEAEAAPMSLKEQADSMALAAIVQLAIAQVRTGPEGPRPCEVVGQTYDMGVIPEDVLAESPLAPYAGARGFAVQCQPRGQTKEDMPPGEGQWLVVLPDDSMTAVVMPCMAEPRTENSPNICWSPPPRQVAETTPAPGPAAASP